MQGQEKKKVVMLLPQPGPGNISPGAPLTLLGVSSLIDRKRFDVKIFATTPKYDYIERVKKHLDGAVCFAVSSLTGYQIKSAIDAIKEVKRKRPGLPIVWGGWHASILPEQTLQSEYADIVVIGQGERTMKELVERLAAGKSLHGLPGIYFKDRDGKIVKNEPRDFEDINNFPRMPFDLINVEDFIVELDGMRALSYMSSQGCPFNCAFCADPLVYRRRWFGLKSKRVGTEIEALAKRYGVELFLIIDENFFVDKNRVKEISREILKRKLRIHWGRVNGRTKQLADLPEETWRLMKKSGCKDLLVGAESGLQEGLDLINKMVTVEDTQRLIELARRYNIEITPSLMVGLPFDAYKNAKKEKEKMRIAEKELDAILDLLDKCYPTKDYFEILLFIYTPYPGNPLFEKSKALGFRPPKRLEEWSNFDIVQQNLPWYPAKMYGRVQHLMEFIFPYACDKYLLRHTKRFKLVHMLFHRTALFRWKHRFYAFPIEHKALRFFKGIRDRLRKQQH